MPETKVIAAVVALVASNIVLHLGANTDVFDPVPEPWRTIIVTAVTFASAWIVKNRHLAPATLARAAQLAGEESK